MTLTLPSETNSLSEIEKLIEDISTTHNLSQELYGKVQITIIEAVNNAIIHGNKLDSKKKVSVSHFVNEKQLIFIIADEGPGFDFSNIPDPTLPENLEKPNGRGIFLMRHLVDEINFARNGAEVELKFNFA